MARRRSFEAGHQRKFMIVVDDSSEVESALYYAASRLQRGSAASLVLLYVIEPEEFTQWAGVHERHVEEQTNTAKALFRLFRRKLNQAGFEAVTTEEVILEGKTSEQIVSLIDKDEDIAILVLGASTDARGPGPLVSSLAAGKNAGSFPIPITIVPGYLDLESIKSLA